MKLSEKICLCRKKQGLSQEALAQMLGVSRQAVSKWETGESEPEIGKLRLLSQTFGVTVDWLLSEDEAPEPPRAPEAPAYPDWLDHLPRSVGRLVRKYGWLAGGYLVLVGLGMAAVGGLGRYLVRAMMPPMDFWGGPLPPNPVTIMTGFMMAVGGVVALLGLILALYLKKKSKE